ncbi:unnamed protein product [Rotaria sp. Silwood2]|nr:unnamed protein product [Rotaria sp. Silwood2]
MTDGQGRGNDLTQLPNSTGVIVDQLGTVYVADAGNDRIMCWPKEAIQGSVVIGGNGRVGQSNQLYWSDCLSFDRQGNLYVADNEINRVRKFNIASNA